MRDVSDTQRMNVIYFAGITLLCQIATLSAAIISWHYYPSLLVILTASTTTGFMFSSIFRLPFAWRLINTVMPCSAWLLLSTSIPSWLFLSITLVLGAIYAPALWTRVPLYPTPNASYAAILADLPIDKPFSFIDVGSGTGQLLFFLARHRPNGEFVGVEAGPIPYLYSRFLKSYYSATNVTVRMQDFWNTNFAAFDWVYTFLSPAAMPKIWEKVKNELEQGTFITNAFPVPAEPTEVVPIKNQRCSALYIHRIQK